MTRDTIYQQPQPHLKEFVFNEQVVAVFDDMIERSVPLYQAVQHATATLAAQLVQPHSTIFDLGCSTGTTLLLMARAINDPTVRFVGIDNSRPMIERCQERIAAQGLAERIELRCADLTTAECDNASLVILHYTLQFVDPLLRPNLLRRIHTALRPGGALLISEKVRHQHPVLHNVLTELHHDFKRSHGYSELEIAGKRDALENVLIPLTTQQNHSLLQEAGFSEVEIFLKWYNFASFAALKGR
ncbi:MAG: carboxy-S-adenosyl-L-methionine synthase CmoA [Kiritimatiellae bacterium]|nr:carboxy-S-adenosyl-L-methionine synthase CmoA [Kiritimatiellia bacterium]